MSDRIIIPIFPLELSLTPGEILPLHIFEPRYKELIAYCRKEPRMRPFGISFVVPMGSAHTLCKVGTAVIVDRVLRENPDGTLDVLVRGVGRFELHQVLERKPYYEGIVTTVTDQKNSPAVSELSQHVAHLMIAVFSKRNETIPHINPNEFSSFSFVVAGLCQLSHEVKQTLIELTSEEARLTTLKETLSTLLFLEEDKPNDSSHLPPNDYLH